VRNCQIAGNCRINKARSVALKEGNCKMSLDRHGKKVFWSLGQMRESNDASVERVLTLRDQSTFLRKLQRGAEEQGWSDPGGKVDLRPILIFSFTSSFFRSPSPSSIPISHLYACVRSAVDEHSSKGSAQTMSEACGEHHRLLAKHGAGAEHKWLKLQETGEAGSARSTSSAIWRGKLTCTRGARGS
jgi:hypothetical protein